MVMENDWLGVVVNLHKVRWNWARLLWVLGREGVYVQTLRCFYLKVVQTILLFRYETWVVKSHIGKNLGGFHHRVVRRNTGKQPWKRSNGSCQYIPLEELMWEAVLE